MTSELSRYLVSIDQVEKLTGLDFLDRLEDTKEAQIERHRPIVMWGSFIWSMTATMFTCSLTVCWVDRITDT